MKVVLKSVRRNISAEGIYDEKAKTLKVLKGAKVSEKISYTEKFKGANKIEKMREGRLKDCILQEDIVFKSPSTAANFVTGQSTNGLRYWKLENGKDLKTALSEVDR